MDKMKLQHIKQLLGFQHFNFSLINEEIKKIENNESENINKDFLDLLVKQQKSQIAPCPPSERQIDRRCLIVERTTDL